MKNLAGNGGHEPFEEKCMKIGIRVKETNYRVIDPWIIT